MTYPRERTWSDCEAELERLREEFLAERKAWENVVAEKHFEIERLREEVKLLNSFRPDAELARLRGLLREGLSEHVRLHVHPYFPAWETRVREALGE